jgi:hypothetical protein
MPLVGIINVWIQLHVLQLLAQLDVLHDYRYGEGACDVVCPCMVC